MNSKAQAPSSIEVLLAEHRRFKAGMLAPEGQPDAVATLRETAISQQTATSATLSIRDWRAFQHYGTRSPPWIKLQARILDEPWWRALSPAGQLLAIKLALLASLYENRIPTDTAWIIRHAALDGPPDLDELLAAGFLVAEASPASEGATNARG